MKRINIDILIRDDEFGDAPESAIVETTKLWLRDSESIYADAVSFEVSVTNFSPAKPPFDRSITKR